MNYVLISLDDGRNLVFPINDVMPQLPNEAIAFTIVNNIDKSEERYVIGKPFKHVKWDQFANLSEKEFNQLLTSGNLENILIAIKINGNNIYWQMNQSTHLVKNFEELNIKYNTLLNHDYVKETNNNILQRDLMMLYNLYMSVINENLKEEILQILLSYRDQLGNEDLTEHAVSYFSSIKKELEIKANELQNSLLMANIMERNGQLNLGKVSDSHSAEATKVIYANAIKLMQIQKNIDVINELLSNKNRNK